MQHTTRVIYRVPRLCTKSRCTHIYGFKGGNSKEKYGWAILTTLGILIGMVGLLIDTSIDETLLALTDGTLATLSDKASKNLLPSIESLLNSQPLSTLSYIAVGNGPGAFTGTRIGVMAAKALAYAANLPLISFCSLKRLIPESDGPFTALLSAKSRGHYALDGHRQGTSITFAPSSRLIPLDDPLPSHTLVFSPSTIGHLIALAEDKFARGLASSPAALEVTYLQ